MLDMPDVATTALTDRNVRHDIRVAIPDVLIDTLDIDRHMFRLPCGPAAAVGISPAWGYMQRREPSRIPRLLARSALIFEQREVRRLAPRSGIWTLALLNGSLGALLRTGALEVVRMLWGESMPALPPLGTLLAVCDWPIAEWCLTKSRTPGRSQRERAAMRQEKDLVRRIITSQDAPTSCLHVAMERMPFEYIRYAMESRKRKQIVVFLQPRHQPSLERVGLARALSYAYRAGDAETARLLRNKARVEIPMGDMDPLKAYDLWTDPRSAEMSGLDPSCRRTWEIRLCCALHKARLADIQECLAKMWRARAGSYHPAPGWNATPEQRDFARTRLGAAMEQNRVTRGFAKRAEPKDIEWMSGVVCHGPSGWLVRSELGCWLDGDVLLRSGRLSAVYRLYELERRLPRLESILASCNLPLLDVYVRERPDCLDFDTFAEALYHRDGGWSVDPSPLRERVAWMRSNFPMQSVSQHCRHALRPRDSPVFMRIAEVAVGGSKSIALDTVMLTALSVMLDGDSHLATLAADVQCFAAAARIVMEVVPLLTVAAEDAELGEVIFRNAMRGLPVILTPTKNKKKKKQKRERCTM